MADNAAASTPGLPEIRRVAAGEGAAWWSEGWRLFKLAPALWIGIIVAYVVIAIVLSQAGTVGNVLSTFATPVFWAGIILGAHDLDHGKPLRFDHLFAGFREGRLGPLLMLGLVSLGLTIIAFSVVGLIAVSCVGASTLMQFFTADASELVGMDMSIMLPLLLVVLPLLAVMLLLVSMFTWFAPGLVAVQKVPALTAVKMSFIAICRNPGALILFDVVLIGLAIVASIPLGLGWLVLGPVFATAWYASWRDIFTQ
jgi:hypothetical protein